MSCLGLNRKAGAFRGGRRPMRVTILKRRTFRHVHHAMVLAAPAAARGQARLCTGWNERHQRPQPVQKNETNAHDATHGAPSYTEIQSEPDSAYSSFYQTLPVLPCGTSKLTSHIIPKALVDCGLLPIKSPLRSIPISRRCAEYVTFHQAVAGYWPLTGFSNGRTLYRLRDRLYSALKPIKQPLPSSSLALAAAQLWRLGSPWKRPSMLPSA